jgi:uncharacterized protein with PQ loop repeat
MVKSTDGLDDTLSFRPWMHDVSSSVKRTLSYIFILVIVLEASFLYFQAFEIFRNESARDVSTVAFIILLITNCYWLFYAVNIVGSMAIASSGVLYIIGSALVLLGRAMYGDGPGIPAS